MSQNLECVIHPEVTLWGYVVDSMLKSKNQLLPAVPTHNYTFIPLAMHIAAG